LNGDTAGGVTTHLALAYHVHELDTGEDDACAAEILEAHRRPDDAFDCAMVLFHNIVQVLDLSDPDRHFSFGVQGIKCGQVRAALVDGDRLRFSIVPDRLFKSNVGQRPSLCGNWFFAAMRAIADQVNLVRPRQLAPIDSRVRNKAPQGLSFRPSS
jgi:hypothetical protein